VFCSKLRPDLLPRGCSKHGVVIAVGLWSIRAAFNDFPDEPLYLGLNEVKRTPGTKPPKPKKKRNLSLNWDKETKPDE
jgi:hypothetical protein